MQETVNAAVSGDMETIELTTFDEETEKKDKTKKSCFRPNPQPQTPYYQQQVGGQPVYVQGGPVDAQRTPMYRSNNANYYGQPQQQYQYQYYPQQRNPDYNHPPNDGMDIFRSNFEERSIRSRFIRRVYTILAIQLIFTTLFITICVFVKPIREYVSRDLLGLILAAVTTVIIYLVLVCVQKTRRTVPLNFILLAGFTIAEAYVFSVISSHYSTFIVFTSMGITAVVCISLSLLACFVCCDITACGMMLCAASVIVSIFGIITIFLLIFLNMSIMFLIYAGLIALLFSMYLIYDTQQIIGGRRIQLSEEEYICGALTLYVDIMQIFWAILALFGYSYGQ